MNKSEEYFVASSSPDRAIRLVSGDIVCLFRIELVADFVCKRASTDDNDGYSVIKGRFDVSNGLDFIITRHNCNLFARGLYLTSHTANTTL